MGTPGLHPSPYNDTAAPWLKRLDVRFPPLGSRLPVSLTPCGFPGGRKGVWVGFLGVSPSFPLPQISFHRFSTLISFISSIPVMVRQAWSAIILAIMFFLSTRLSPWESACKIIARCGNISPLYPLPPSRALSHSFSRHWVINLKQRYSLFI